MGLVQRRGQKKAHRNSSRRQTATRHSFPSMHEILGTTMWLPLWGLAVPLLQLLLTGAVEGVNNPSHGDGELVLVKELRVDRVRRSAESPLPRYLHMQLTVGGETMTLQLEKNTDIDTNIPFTFAGDKNRKVYIPDRQEIGFYQDEMYGAVISVTAKLLTNDSPYNVLEGSFNFNDTRYVIQPVDDMTSEQQYKEGVPHRLQKVVMPKEYDDTVASHYEKFTAEMHNITAAEGGPRHRQKRGTTIESYYVELLFILDHTIYDYWMAKANNERDALSKIKYYYLHQMNGIDLAYKSIDSNVWGIRISPFLTEFHIAKTKAESIWTTTNIFWTGSTIKTTYIYGSGVLKKMVNWKLTGGRSWKKPDHVMLWTQYNLYSSSELTIGLAYNQAICNGGSAVSIIEDNGLNYWQVAAHELGHSLGGSHDGTDNACSKAALNIMSPIFSKLSNTTFRNAFMFSPCSIQEFKDLFSGRTDGFPRICLLNRKCSHGVPTDDLDILPGSVYSLDEQCAMHFGENYTFYYNGTDNETICYEMYCYSPGNEYPYYMRGAAFGTPCGINKLCYKGECIDNSSYPTVAPTTECNETILITTVPAGCTDKGEQFTINGVYSTCADIVTRYSKLCFTWAIARTKCCQSCHSAGLQPQIERRDETTTAATTVITTPQECSETTLITTVPAVKCFSCGEYDNDMRSDCGNPTYYNISSCTECWVYRLEVGETVTFARGCKSESSKVTLYRCDDYHAESCSTTGTHKLCALCCDTSYCNSGKLSGMKDDVDVIAANVLLLLMTGTLPLVVNCLL